MAEAVGGDRAEASAGSSPITGIQDGLLLLARQRGVEWDHCRGSWGLNILTVEEDLKMCSKSLSCSTNRGTGWPKEAPKVSWAFFQQVGQLSAGTMGCTVAGLAKSVMGS